VPAPGALVARVVTDVSGVNKEFDYLVPGSLAPTVRVGAQVRVDLSGRRVGGWVTGVGVDPPAGVALRALAKVRGWGPEPELVDLASWAAWRWAGRRGAFLSTASPPKAVPSLPAPALRPPAPPATASAAAAAVASAPLDRAFVLRLPPALDTTPVIAELAQRGPLLVVVPSVERAAVLADRLGRAGGDVAVIPDDWAQARAGAGVVIGARGAAWAPCPGLAAVAVVDGHDEALGQEQAPTWHAATVAAERARRRGVPCVILTPCPTLELEASSQVWVPERAVERRGWAPLEIVDRRRQDPRLGLYSERLVALLRGEARVVCVLNRTGRARLLACAACEELARCEQCGAALAQQPAGGAPPYPLLCPRCGLFRPQVCASCGSTVLRHLRVGVSRAREELEVLSGRAVGEVTAATVDLPSASVLVGTEAVLHRAGRADAVAFLEFDQELLAPRVRAAAEALALLAAASRLVGGRRGRVLVQTRVPDHPAIQAALRADASVLNGPELQLRRSLGLPPATSVAVVSGPVAAAYVGGLAALPGGPVATLGPDGDEWLVKASDPATLADALAAVPRPAGRLRVAVDPARL
jgi:primosomal protein N' (replication factor Y) (superfamily II helicase)